jgi:hypothetical protein
MIDIEETVARAIESPVAPPPEMAHVEKLAGRHRRRRTVARATAGATAVALAVAIGTAVISTRDNDRVKVATTSPSPTVSSSTTVASAPTTLDELVSRLKVDHAVVDEGTVTGSPLAPLAHLLCVDGTTVHVYEYSDDAARAADSDMISPDGSELRSGPDSNGNSHGTIIEWIGPPHFFASGRIIVLVLTDDAPLLGWMTDVLGPTLSPEAHASPTRDACSASATTSTAGP